MLCPQWSIAEQKQQLVYLKKLSECKHLNHLKQVQALSITLGHSQTQVSAFKLLRFAATTLSNLPYARLLFDRLSSPNVHAFAALITAYTFHRLHLSSLLLFRHMLRLGTPSDSSSRPNHFIFPQVLKSVPEVMEPRTWGSVHAHVIKTGFDDNPVVQTALVDCYARWSRGVQDARKVFDEMPERTVVTWTAMVSGYIRLGDVENAMVLFESMPDRDVPSWNAIIAGCAQNGLFSLSVSLFKRLLNSFLRDSHIRPNHVTVASALSACGHGGMLHLGKWIHGFACRNGLVPDSFISNALTDMYGKCGSLKEARWVFDMTLRKELTSWNSMINCYALHGKSKNAIMVFEEMIASEDDVKPDKITFVGLFNACTHGGLVAEGIAYFDLMTKVYEIKPEIQHYGCMIDLLGRAGQFDKAMEVVKGMEMEPDEAVWGSLLNGCKIHRRTDLAELALQKLMEIDPHNGGYASMLANIYGEMGNWEEVRKVRKMLKERNAYKTPGCSWVEVNEQVYQFHSADTSHPRIKEIHHILETLVGFISLIKTSQIQ
ncbi:hypothetical protein TIFTF001_028858 [Ficus carica]|uniref:Chlororespiratory reduction 4 n=1 Tax=Ficus carica TaxID=3494 RepID=A0AA88DRB9_FICCA|nr:hypothetical protein TIFTF001_028858 [Ficus carica]